MSDIRVFGEFKLDIDNQQLWYGDELRPLRPNPMAVLAYLVDRPDQLVTKDDLLRDVWENEFVVDGVIKTSMSDIRKALRDNPKKPRYVETVHRRGYRFVGYDNGEPETSTQRNDSPVSNRVSSVAVKANDLFGRDEEILELERLWAEARNGHSQLVVLEGEAGVGKTALARSFTASLNSEVWLGFGQCVDLHGQTEPYLPLLEAIESIGHEDILAPALRRYAINWLRTLPSLWDAADESLQASPGEPARMPREFAELVKQLAIQKPVVLVLEDIHWADPSTLALLTTFASRPTNSSVFIVATMRPPAQVDHTLRTSLQGLNRFESVTTLKLNRLGEQSIRDYLNSRFSFPAFSEEMSTYFYKQTGGNPLFFNALCDSCIQAGTLYEEAGQWKKSETMDRSTIPESIASLIDDQILTLDAQCRELLAIAAVDGDVFSTFGVAEISGQEQEDIEDIFESLVDAKRFIVREDSPLWPDYHESECYRFVHNLYRESFYHSNLGARRRRYHRQLAECLEKIYESQEVEIASRLAHHFAEAQLTEKAVHYLMLAADKSIKYSSLTAANLLMERAESICDAIKDPDLRRTNLARINILFARCFRGDAWNGNKAIESYKTAQSFLNKDDSTSNELFSITSGLLRVYFYYGELKQALDAAAQLGEIAMQSSLPLHVVSANLYQGIMSRLNGEFASAIDSLSTANTLIENTPESELPRTSPIPLVVECLSHLGLCYAETGNLPLAEQTLETAQTYADKLDDSNGLTAMMSTMAELYAMLGEANRVIEFARSIEQVRVNIGPGIGTFTSDYYLGYAVSLQGDYTEGIHLMERNVAQQVARGWPTYRSHPHKASQRLALAYAQSGDIDKACSLIKEVENDLSQNLKQTGMASFFHDKALIQVLADDMSEASRSISTALDLANQAGNHLAALKILSDMVRHEVEPDASDKLLDMLERFNDEPSYSVIEAARKLVKKR